MVIVCSNPPPLAGEGDREAVVGGQSPFRTAMLGTSPGNGGG
jgi:hypothetical protein